MNYNAFLPFVVVHHFTIILLLYNFMADKGVVFKGNIPENATNEEIKNLWNYWAETAKLNDIRYCVEGHLGEMVLTCHVPALVRVVDFPGPPSPSTASPSRRTILVDLRGPLETPNYYVDAIEKNWEPDTEIYCLCNEDDCSDHPLFSFWTGVTTLNAHAAAANLPYPDVYITSNMGESDKYWLWVQNLITSVVVPEMPIVDEDVPCLRVVSGSAPELVQRLVRMFSDLSNEPYYLNKGLDPFLDDVIDGYGQTNVIDAPREMIPQCHKSILFYIWAEPNYICGEYDTKCWRDQLMRETEYINSFDEVVVVNLDDWIYRMSEILPEIVVALGRTGFDIKGRPSPLRFFEMDYDLELDAVADWMQENFIVQDFPNDLEIPDLYEDLRDLILI
jgi:hypothetical protein